MARQAHFTAVVRAFLIGCAVVLMAGASGVQVEASQQNKQKHTEATNNEQGRSPQATASEEAQCEGTRTYRDKFDMSVYTTNDLPGCPKGGLLLGTEGSDQTRSRDPARPYSLYGGDGDDEIRGLGGSDTIFHGYGDDIIYGGDGDDDVYPDSGNDVIYGGAGNDDLDSGDDGGDKLYCGAGRDKYIADKNDYVDSSCEKEPLIAQFEDGLCARIDKKLDENRPLSREESRIHAGICAYTGEDVIGVTSSASAPQVLASGGGPSILLPAAALLFGSGILTYAILRRR